MDESGEAEGRRNKCLKLNEKEDRISDLPDSLLQHILSLLPSTKEAVQTCVLSKRWKNQWTRLQFLIFDFRSGMSSDTNSVEDFIRFIDNTLLHHDCSKVKKLHLDYDFRTDTNFSAKIQFATRKQVEELILDFCFDIVYPLPKFLFDNVSLVKLDMSNCYFMDDWSVNWGSLKAFRFKMKGFSQRDMVANVLSGSPLLEWLELDGDGEGNFVIDSKSLKILILVEVDIDHENLIKISCPNLEELILVSRQYYCSLPDRTIENILSGCPLLHSLELKTCTFDKLVIASKSLKKLVLIAIDRDCEVEISCPNLEELNLIGLKNDTFKVMNFPSLICASLDFEIPRIEDYPSSEYVAKQILEQLQNVEELSMGETFIEILSEMGGGLSYPWLNNKILTLNDPFFEHLPGIVCALRSSPMLEKLVINLRLDQRQKPTYPGVEIDCEKENYLVQYSNKTVFNCSVSNLKIVKIVGLSDRDEKHKSVLNFVEFLLKNARVLEKIVVILADCGTTFLFEVSKKLLTFQRCFPHTTIELLCSN